MVADYLLFHYGAPHEVLPWPGGPTEALDFAARTPRHLPQEQVARALDLGCAVGRSAFEMTRWADEVIGIDFSEGFIRQAQILASGQPTRYSIREEAHLTKELEATVPANSRPDCAHFEVGDAMNLRADLGAFDHVHAANLICRLPKPQLLLDRLPSLVVPGGTLVLTTPATWLDDFTPPENWPDLPTVEWLKSHLSADFDLVSQVDEPFLIRETRRKFQWTVASLTTWQRKA